VVETAKTTPAFQPVMSIPNNRKNPIWKRPVRNIPIIKEIINLSLNATRNGTFISSALFKPRAADLNVPMLAQCWRKHAAGVSARGACAYQLVVHIKRGHKHATAQRPFCMLAPVGACWWAFLIATPQHQQGWVNIYIVVMNNPDEKVFSCVLGYLPQIDRQSKTAVELNLPARFSIALDSYRPSIGEMQFDLEMFLVILQELEKQIVYNQLTIDFGDDDIQSFPSLSASIKIQEEKWEAFENEPFSSARFSLNNEPVCYIEFEDYSAIGGPIPYHDSFNFAFYTRPDLFDRYQIEQSVLNVSKQNKFVLEHFLEGTFKWLVL
jgi:hypothetical protein